MITVTVETDVQEYPIYIGSDVLSLSTELKNSIQSDQVLVVSNQQIADLHLSRLTRLLSGYQVVTHLIPDGENFKSLKTYAEVIEILLQNGFRRNATIIAFGGGVVGDLAGFVAATYQRGVPFIQFPTTLLAMVDSSVGGKTAVNHDTAKNMIGAFYQPRSVFADIDVLATLSEQQFSAGMAEVIKYGLIYDFTLFEYLETNFQSILNRDKEALTKIIAESCKIKAEVVGQDEKEKGLRAILNLGHTFGHALEKLGDYQKYLHGEAVAIGTLMAFELSVQTQKISRDYFERVKSLFSSMHLPVSVDENWRPEQIFKLMKLDKKNTSSRVTLILPKGYGKVEITDSIEECEVLRAIEVFLPRVTV